MKDTLMTMLAGVGLFLITDTAGLWQAIQLAIVP